MEMINPSHLVGEVIQLALAPAFLLVAIGSFLNVVTQRLARVIDRARALEERCRLEPDALEEPGMRGELGALDRRIVYAQWAINFCAVAALLVAFLVVILFLADLVRVNAAAPIAVLFSLAMAALISALVAFMVEILIATRTIRVRTGV